jgi:hypothetical protein
VKNRAFAARSFAGILAEIFGGDILFETR